jgi:glycosyltransferase involved in cell wall biosynthesis
MLRVLHTEASTGWGGQEIRIVQESLGMITRGYSIVIAAPRESEIYKRAQSVGIRVLDASFNKKNPYSVWRLASTINKERIDILNTHSSSDSWVATIGARILRRSPVIIRTRHLSTPISRSFLSRLIYNILPDAIITTGGGIRERMIRYNGFRGEKIYSIPTGIDLGRFNPENTDPAIDKKSFTVGMVSVLRSWKGHEYFIRAVPEIMKSIPDVRFYIAGAGPKEDEIRSLIRSMSLERYITMLGHREDIPEIMASLDVLVHPSYANEGVPQSVLQALAMRKAVVASDTGAINEVILDGETGFLVEKKNPSLIARKVILLYMKPELRDKFGNAGRSLVQNRYSMDHMLDSIEELYRRVLKSRQKKSLQ